jgi:hypothetical protein
MPVNILSGDSGTQSMMTAYSLDKSAKVDSRVTEKLTIKQDLKPATSDTNVKKVDTPAKSPLNEVSSELNKKPVREMSHVLETYNPKGKLILKFVDSNNNVLYQIPAEMASKIENQMFKSKTSTDVKA